MESEFEKKMTIVIHQPIAKNMNCLVDIYRK